MFERLPLQLSLQRLDWFLASRPRFAVKQINVGSNKASPFKAATLRRKCHVAYRAQECPLQVDASCGTLGARFVNNPGLTSTPRFAVKHPPRVSRLNRFMVRLNITVNELLVSLAASVPKSLANSATT